MFRMFTACWIYEILANAPFITLSLCLSPPPPNAKSRRSRWCFCEWSLKNHISPKNYYFISAWLLRAERWVCETPGVAAVYSNTGGSLVQRGLWGPWTVTMECRPFLSGCSRCMMTSSFEYIPGQNFKPFRSACIKILLFLKNIYLYI